MSHHRLDASPDTVHWGYFDGSLPPVLTVAPGDTVTISTVSGPPEMMPKDFEVPRALAAIHAAMKPKLPGHICTGPVAVRGARAGQVLKVSIDAIGLHYDWCYTFSAPQKGALPDDFDALLNRWAGPQLCRTDSLQLLDRTSRIPRGFVVLGDFVPYKKAPAAAK